MPAERKDGEIMQSLIAKHSSQQCSLSGIKYLLRDSLCKNEHLCMLLVDARSELWVKLLPEKKMCAYE